MITKEEMEKILRDIPEGGKITMKDLCRGSGWAMKDVQKFLIDYDERQVKTVGHEPIGRAIEDFVYFPDRRLTTYPVYEVTAKPVELPTARPDIEDEDVMPRTISMGRDTVTIPIGRKFSATELEQILRQAGATSNEAEDTVDWWLEIGDIYATTTRGAPVFMTVSRGLSVVTIREVKKVEMHKLPYTRWDPLEFYEYMMRTFGWSKGESRDYFYGLLDKGTIESVKFRDYRTPKEIPVEVYKRVKVTPSEPKPIALRVVAVTRWQARSGAGYKDEAHKKAGQPRKREYDQDHELDAFIRIPKSTSEREMSEMALDLIQLALTAHQSQYPSVHELQKPRLAGGWQASKPTLNTTALKQADGDWLEYFNGEPRQSGEFDADKFYRAYRIKVE